MNRDARCIKDKYNPERDTAVGGDKQPICVTWAVYALLQMIERLESRVAELEQASPQSVNKVDCRGANMSGAKNMVITGTTINR